MSDENYMKEKGGKQNCSSVRGEGRIEWSKQYKLREMSFVHRSSMAMSKRWGQAEMVNDVQWRESGADVQTMNVTKKWHQQSCEKMKTKRKCTKIRRDKYRCKWADDACVPATDEADVEKPKKSEGDADDEKPKKGEGEAEDEKPKTGEGEVDDEKPKKKVKDYCKK
ncbi:hypothetical protein niasHS_006985 [Heterodera schachtii]|uniref:Uncharacterized protein n=1 Tax=Heterodera schachtii TaxID=97005 RepID=A0ABD2JF80_HETSC